MSSQSGARAYDALLMESVAAFCGQVGVSVASAAAAAGCDPLDAAAFKLLSPPALLLDAELNVFRAYGPRIPAGSDVVHVPDATPGAHDTWRTELVWAVKLSHVENRRQMLPPCPCSGDGNELALMATVSPVVHEGRELALVSFARVAAEDPALEAIRAALRKQTTFLEAVIENIPDMVFVKEAEELRFVRMNRAGERLLGHRRDELLGKNDFDFFPEAEARAFTAADRAVLEGREQLDVAEEPIHTESHGTRYLHTKKVPLIDPETGEAQYLLGISEDITDRRRATEAIEAARTAAEQANLAKTRFLANMSHELRTPLTAILGYAEMLQEDADNPQTMTDLGRIVAASEHLLTLISGVLDLSKIEADRLELAPEWVDIHALVASVAETVEPLVARNGNTLVTRVDPAVRRVFTDPLRVRQCLLNLASNASKFTSNGSIAIRLKRCDDPALFALEVEDDGVGMSDAQVAQVFEPFYQVDSSTSRKVGGTGLGLTITHRLVTMMGGTIDVDSTPGVGTRFIITLATELDPS